MKSLKAVVFDMDGVITETSRQHFLAWELLAKDLGFDLPAEVNDQVKGISRMESLDIVLKAGNMAERFNDEEKHELAEKKNEIYQTLIKAFTKENLSEGAYELLASLKKNNIKIALASVSKNAQFLIEAMEIGNFFDVVVDPREVKRGKPAPDIFEMAAAKLGVEPASCIGIEDAYAGIESIKSAGMKPVGIGNAAVLTNCSTVYASLTELNIDILKQMIE